jgi:hypothetical protein
MSTPFDAVSVEYAFARLAGASIGGRGTPHDADVFRGGNPASLAGALDEAISAIGKRIATVTWTAADQQPGGAKARLDVALSRLQKISKSMSTSKSIEPNDYHWEIIGSLISTIDVLLEKL